MTTHRRMGSWQAFEVKPLESTDAFSRALRDRLLRCLPQGSIRAVSEALGVNHETLRRALRTGRLTLAIVRAVCETTGVSADWLLFGRGAMFVETRSDVHVPPG